MLFADGTVGPNQYGEDPKNRMPYQPQPTSVNVTVNVSRETPAEAPAEEEKTEKAEQSLISRNMVASCKIRFARGIFLLPLRIGKQKKEDKYEKSNLQ